MAANAPYYQMCVGQLPTDTNTPKAVTQTASIQGDYRSTSTTAAKKTTEQRHLSLYPEHAARQHGDNNQDNVEENNNLVDLLEAATTAASHNPGAANAMGPSADGKRTRDSYPHTGVATPTRDDKSSVTKRRRIDTSPIDLNINNNGVDTHVHSPSSNTSPSPSRDSLLIDARAAGVHSAAALFRRSTSNAARKYTRPPMSKLFMSLNITPENFIALQALAKNYMLSPAHPERQACVGNRGKSDTDMVKLRLFNCVRDFLTDGGVGEQFFGEHVEKPGERECHEAAAALGEEESGREKLVWPRDGNKIIGLVTPLLRRMVTNERQRLYAIDTRKGTKKIEKGSNVDAHGRQSPPTPHVQHQLHTMLDPTLQHTPRSSPSTLPVTATPSHPLNGSPPLTRLSTLTPPPLSSTSPLPPVSADPHLTNINIFLLYTSGASKPIKLDEKRIVTTRPAHLTFYNYTAFLEQVDAMVKHAEVRYPVVTPVSCSGAAVGSGSERQTDTKTKTVTETGTGTGTKSLRGLAAAANALHDGSEQISTSDTSVSVSSTGAGFGGGVNYTVKTIGPTGWTVIDSAESWYHVLTERAFAVWADGVCNVIIEVDAGRSVAGARMEGSEVVMEDA